MENVGALINLTLRMCDTQADVKSLQKSVEVMEEKLATIKEKLQQQELFNKTQADNTLALQTQLNMLTAKIREEYESKQEPNDPKILVLKSAIPIMTISELHICLQRQCRTDKPRPMLQAELLDKRRQQQQIFTSFVQQFLQKSTSTSNATTGL